MMTTEEGKARRNGDSPPVVSNQGDFPHKRLRELVLKHLSSRFQKPIREFAGVSPQMLAAQPFVLDLGCGTGMSTEQLSSRHPGSLILGIDKSASRLSRGRELGELVRLIRADAVDVLLLLEAHTLKAEKTYIIYPNPWPKSEHVKRRWHAHPIFPTLLNVSAEIELRTNWKVYAEEFSAALALAGWTYSLASLTVKEPISLHEKKYSESAHSLWQIIARPHSAMTEPHQR